MDKQIQLPKRIQKIVDLIPPSSCIADIGCDHAYVPIEAVRQGKAQHAIACDVRTGPLQHAEEHILFAGLAGKIETRCSDGLGRVQAGEADTVVMAGMGGPLMERLLLGRLDDFPHFVLSPQSEIPHFRHFLLDQGMKIEEETMLVEDGKYYVILNVSKNQEGHTSTACAPGSERDGQEALQDAAYMREEDFLYGGRLLQRKDPVLKAFLKKEKQRYEEILTKTDAAEIRAAYAYCVSALEVFQ